MLRLSIPILTETENPVIGWKVYQPDGRTPAPRYLKVRAENLSSGEAVEGKPYGDGTYKLSLMLPKAGDLVELSATDLL